MKMHENRNNNNMEPFYEDNNQYAATTTAAQSQPANNLKRPLTLDLNAAANNNKGQTRKQRLNQSTGALLNSPDLNMLKIPLATPDLEKFILSNASTLQTPTPSFMYTANSINATSEQIDFSEGFVDALNSIRDRENAKQHQHQNQHQQQQQHQLHIQPNSTNKYTTAAVTSGAIVTTTATPATILSTVGMSGGTAILTNLDDRYPATIKDEPQNEPNSPPMTPIGMDNQEKIKLERKRQRNRVAAYKCRKRKLERISKLEDKVKLLKGENAELGSIIKSMKEHVFHLKQQVIEHIQHGCSIPSCNIQYFGKTSNTNDSDIK